MISSRLRVTMHTILGAIFSSIVVAITVAIMPATRWMLLAMTIVAAPIAQAHKPSDAYIELESRGNQIQMRWDIALRDLDLLLDLDSNRDGQLSWAEVRRRHAEIGRAGLEAMSLQSSKGACKTGPVSHALVQHSDGVYAVLSLELECPSKADQVELSYRMFRELDPSHRAIIKHGDGSTVVTPDGKPVKLNLSGALVATPGGGGPANALTASSSLLSHIQNGMHHILVGWDHLAFIVLMVLPAVLRRHQGRWQAESDARASLKVILLTVTAFTLAHSITLSASVLQWLTPPSRWVESAIALSILVAAAMNLLGTRQARWWPVALLFGLVHGFGFASALNDAGLDGGSLAWGLLGFNLGVELGQLVFIAMLWPLIWFTRNIRLWSQAAVPALSSLLAIAGGIWLLERLFLINLLPG